MHAGSVLLSCVYTHDRSVRLSSIWWAFNVGSSLIPYRGVNPSTPHNTVLTCSNCAFPILDVDSYYFGRFILQNMDIVMGTLGGAPSLIRYTSSPFNEIEWNLLTYSHVHFLFKVWIHILIVAHSFSRTKLKEIRIYFKWIAFLDV